MAKKFNMPLLLTTAEEKRVFPRAVQMPFDRESQAKKNHDGQTFEVLASRCGLSPVEAIAVMRGKPWEFLPRDQVCDWFLRYGWFSESKMDDPKA